MLEAADSLLVEDAIEEVLHSISPETPLHEVVDLMVRQQVGAVPVVSEESEVLGIISSGDALDQILRDSPSESSGPRDERLTARDVMTRTVLCVSEGQPLIEAAHMMVNKKVEQLPVVREGVLIGIVTRGEVLRALHGAAAGHLNTGKVETGDGS